MLRIPRPQKTLRGYLDQYAAEHTTLGNKITHMIGIPLVVASIPTAFVAPPVAGALFVSGWALQVAGHHLFEKRSPAFSWDPYYLLAGPVWVALEMAELSGLEIPVELSPHVEAPAPTPAPSPPVVIRRAVSPLN